MTERNDKFRHCSYCDKDETQVSNLVAGLQVFICDECLITASLIIITKNPNYDFLGKLSEAMRTNDELRAASTKTLSDSTGDKS